MGSSKAIRLKLIMMEGLEVLKYLEQLHPFSNSFRAALLDGLIEERYRKNEVIYGPSHAETRVWFVASGYLFRYQVYHSIKIVDLYKENTFIMCCPFGKTNSDFIQVLADCRLWTVPNRKLKNLRETERDGAIVERLVLMQELLRREKSIAMVRSPLEQRVQLFLDEFPEIFRVAPLQIICSYLNMSRESLRRLRNKR